jgi:hypothetical protein
VTSIPDRVGPAVFEQFGKQVAVKAPREFDEILKGAGGLWDPGSRRWLVERRRIGPVIRTLQRNTDPLFRHAGLSV